MKLKIIIGFCYNGVLLDFDRFKYYGVVFKYFLMFDVG